MKVICDGCGVEFERIVGEVNRSIRLRRKQFCTRKCMGRIQIDNIPKDKRNHPENLRPRNRGDEFSPYRKDMRCIKRRDPNTKLTVQDLKKLYESQNGLCALTSKIMSFTKSGKSEPLQASVDRIDSTRRGYQLDNIQYVCLAAQFAKHIWSNDLIKQEFFS